MEEFIERPSIDKMTRRDFLRLSAVAGVSLLAVACGPVTETGGTESVNQHTSTGSVDGTPNPPGTVNVLVSGQEAWVPADENGYPEPGSAPFK